MAQINDIPAEILIRIFRHVVIQQVYNETQDASQYRLECRSWDPIDSLSNTCTRWKTVLEDLDFEVQIPNPSYEARRSICKCVHTHLTLQIWRPQAQELKPKAQHRLDTKRTVERSGMIYTPWYDTQSVFSKTFNGSYPSVESYVGSCHRMPRRTSITCSSKCSCIFEGKPDGPVDFWGGRSLPLTDDDMWMMLLRMQRNSGRSPP